MAATAIVTKHFDQDVRLMRLLTFNDPKANMVTCRKIVIIQNLENCENKKDLNNSDGP